MRGLPKDQLQGHGTKQHPRSHPRSKDEDEIFILLQQAITGHRKNMSLD